MEKVLNFVANFLISVNDSQPESSRNTLEVNKVVAHFDEWNTGCPIRVIERIC